MSDRYMKYKEVISRNIVINSTEDNSEYIEEFEKNYEYIRIKSDIYGIKILINDCSEADAIAFTNIDEIELKELCINKIRIINNLDNSLKDCNKNVSIILMR